jgi:hypothetical protein
VKKGKGNERVYESCLQCYSSDVVNTRDDDPINMTRDELVKALEDSNYGVSGDASLLELQEMYVVVVQGGAVEITESAQYPILQSTDIPTFAKFDFKDGGRLVQDDALSPKMVVNVVSLFAGLVTFSDKYIQQAKNDKEKHVVECCPDIIVHFAKESRSRGGQRLMKRAHRHTQDRKTAPLDAGGARGSFFKHDGKFGCKIEHTIQPSMRTGTQYTTSVAFTKEDLVACCCNCKSGPENNDSRHVCVHVLVPVMMLTYLLFDGLAQHLLYELTALWNDEKGKCLSDVETQQFCADLKKLMIAAGATTCDSPIPMELLQQCRVGTEKPKRAPRPLDPKLLKRFRDYKFSDPCTFGHRKMKEAKNNEAAIAVDLPVNENQTTSNEATIAVDLPVTNENETTNNQATKVVVDYDSIMACTKVFSDIYPAGKDVCGDAVGFKLLPLRKTGSDPIIECAKREKM